MAFSRSRGPKRRVRQPSNELQRKLGITKRLPEDPMMPEGKIKHPKPAKSKKLRPILGYV